jgi:hypothetical protein
MVQRPAPNLTKGPPEPRASVWECGWLAARAGAPSDAGVQPALCAPVHPEQWLCKVLTTCVAPCNLFAIPPE